MSLEGGVYLERVGGSLKRQESLKRWEFLIGMWSLEI